MGRKSVIEIKESIEDLESFLKSNRNFKIQQRIQSLIYTKRGKFITQKELSDFLDIDYATLKRWLKKYKEQGLDAQVKRIKTDLFFNSITT